MNIGKSAIFYFLLISLPKNVVFELLLLNKGISFKGFLMGFDIFAIYD
jgi:hypothetical protein